MNTSPVIEVRACHRSCALCPAFIIFSIPGPGGSAFASTDDVVDTAARYDGWVSWAGRWYCEACEKGQPWADIACRDTRMEVVGFSDREIEQMKDKAVMRDATWNRGRR